MVRRRVRARPRIRRCHLSSAIPAVRRPGGHATRRAATRRLVRSGVGQPRVSPRTAADGRRGKHDILLAGLPPRPGRDGSHDRVDRGEGGSIGQVRPGHVAHRVPQSTPQAAGRRDDVDDRPTVRSSMATEQIFYDDVEPGDALATLTVTVDETQMFFFSAATYNGHRIHYDKDWARDVEGYDNVLVHGPLQAALLSRALTDWIGGGGRLVAFSVQNRAIAYPGQELIFGGVVTGKRMAGRQACVDLDVFCRRGDDVLMPGTATVALPRRSTP